MKSILDIRKAVDSLDERDLFDRFFTVDERMGRLKVPKEMEAWVKSTFGSVDRVEEQKIIKVFNKFTFESSLFNALRAERPVDASSDSSAVDEIKESKGGPFCHAETGTPEDLFGRVEGDRSVSASNVAKYDKWHGLVIFNEHDPLEITKVGIKDYLGSASEWLGKAHSEDSESIFPYVLWHCLWKSAASIVHGHMQLLLTSKNHYGSVEFLNHVRQEYAKNYGADYFDDYYTVHKELDLAFEDAGARVITHLVPKKEKEVIIIGSSLEGLADPLYRVLSAYRGMGVESFTVGIALPPLEHREGWEGFPVVARIIDRGDLSKKTADFGAMEIFAGSSVVASDPFRVHKRIRDEL